MSRIARSPSAERRAVAVLLAFAWASPALAGDGDRPPESYDCIIEPSRVLELGSAAVGVLQEVRVERSDRVEAGEVVALLESGVEAATVELARLRAGTDTEVLARQVTFELQRSTRDRTERLHATRVVAAQAREEAAHDARLSALRLRQAEEEKRLAELEFARARQSLARRTIRSPIAGVVVERHKSPGERVEDQPILRIAQLHPLRVEVVLPVERYGAVREGMRARVIPQYAPGGELEAEVTAIDAVLDAASSTFGVRLSLPNPHYEVPGGLRCTLEFLPGVPAPVNAAATAPGAASVGQADATTAEPHGGSARHVDATPAEPRGGSAGHVDAKPAELDGGSAGHVDAKPAELDSGSAGHVDAKPAELDGGSVGHVDATPAEPGAGNGGQPDATMTAPAREVLLQADAAAAMPVPEAGSPRHAAPAVPAQAAPPEKNAPALMPATVQVRAPDAQTTECRTLGPLADEEQAARLRRAFARESVAARVWHGRAEVPVGYLVAVDSAEVAGGAESVVAALRQEGLRDFQVLTATPGIVSVGYFRAHESARYRAARVQAIGLPARVQTRTKKQDRYFLDMELPVGPGHEDLQGRVLAPLEMENLSSAACAGMVTASR